MGPRLAGVPEIPDDVFSELFPEPDPRDEEPLPEPLDEEPLPEPREEEPFPDPVPDPAAEAAEDLELITLSKSELTSGKR